MQLADKSVLITGAGSGIGRKTIVALARRQARLALTGRRSEPLQHSAELARAEGAETLILPGDVTDDEWRCEALEAVEERFDGLDVLINSAGVVSAGDLGGIPKRDIRRQVDINLTAPILLIQEALPLLRRNRGAIVNVSSSIGLVGMPYYAPYAATKGGLSRFSEALRRELSEDDIDVMSVYPVATDTPMMETARSGGQDDSGYETAESVADALVAGLENDARDVIRGGPEFAELVRDNCNEPEEADRRMEQMKEKLRRRASRHRSL